MQSHTYRRAAHRHITPPSQPPAAPSTTAEALKYERLNFTASPGLYELSDEADTVDMFNQITIRLAGADAMLELMASGQGATFRRLNADLQDNYLFACSSMVSECR